MKFKSLFFALLLLIGHHFVANYLKKSGSNIMADQGQWSQNSIYAQTFLYDFNPPKYNCIVGTSLAKELVEDSLPSNYYNLCFRGLNVLDGLLILKQKSILPDTLFIETNYITRDYSEEFINKMVGSKTAIDLKGAVVMLQERYLPIGLFANFVQSKFGFVFYYYRYFFAVFKHKISSTKTENTNQISLSNDTEKIFDDVLKLRQESMAILPDEQKTNEQIEKTKEILVELEKRSVKLIFIEMPIHCSLVDTKVMKTNRKKIRDSFSPVTYQYLNLGKCQDFETTDGIHLNKESAVRCTAVFLDKVSSL